MKAISVKQPFATLIVRGIKRFEARSWSTPHRGPLAIHASSNVATDFLDSSDEVDELGEAVIELGWIGAPDIRALPRSAVVGTAWLAEVHPAQRIWNGMTRLERALVGCHPDDDAPQGTYFWELRDAVEIVPFSIDGKLRLWEVPERLAHDVVQRVADAKGSPLGGSPDSGRVEAALAAREERKAAADRELNAPTLTPSAALAAITGPGPISRMQITQRLWEYIKQHGLQDNGDPQYIRADDTLRAVVRKKRIDLYEMTERVSEHVS